MDKNIIIKDALNLDRLKKVISKEGNKKLHVLSDFDRTLTYAFVNGEKIPSIISILRDGTYLTEDYAGKAHELFNKYHPIEINLSISLQEKKKAMNEWWRSHFELLIKSGLNRNDLKKVVKSDKIRLRDGCLEFIRTLHEYDIPLVIMSSSGLGTDSIYLYLKEKGIIYNNVFIVSNQYIWDKKGNAIGIKEPVIHSMNKDEKILDEFPFYDKIKNRKNVLLLGDYPEDIGMVEGFKYDNLIKIGFLNEDVKKNLKFYNKAYDALILNDSPMDYVNKMLKDILKN